MENVIPGACCNFRPDVPSVNMSDGMCGGMQDKRLYNYYNKVMQVSITKNGHQYLLLILAGASADASSDKSAGTF